MKRAIATTACLLLLAGCSAPAAAPVTPLTPNPPAPAATTSAPSATPTPTPTPTGTRNARGNLVKAIGQDAAIRDDTGATLVTFKITAVEPHFKCTAELSQKSQNGNFVAVSIDMTTAASRGDGKDITMYLDASEFSVVGPDGTTENDSSGSAYACIPAKKQLPSTVGPGQHVVGMIVLDSEYSSGGIVFTQPGLTNGWEWSF